MRKASLVIPIPDYCSASVQIHLPSAEGQPLSSAKASGFGDSSSSRPSQKPHPLSFSRSEDELPGLGAASGAPVATKSAAPQISTGGAETSSTAGGRMGTRGSGADVSAGSY